MGYTQDVRRAYHARGALFAVLGIVLVFGGTVLVNQLTEAPDPEAEQRSRPVDLVRKAPPPPKPKPRAQQPRPPRVARTAPPPPLAALNSGLSGVDLGIDFGAGDFSQIDDSLLGDEDVVMTDDVVDVRPRPRSRSPLPYPPGARKQGIEGYVLVSVLIDEAGQVEDARVVESTPQGVFDQLVLEAIRGWEFSPAEYKGEKVRVWANQRIRFDLS